MTPVETIVAAPGHTLCVRPSQARPDWFFAWCECGYWNQLLDDHDDLVRLGGLHAEIATGPASAEVEALRASLPPAFPR